MLLHRENRGEFMTLDEAITCAKEISSRDFNDMVYCIKCSEIHGQIAEWLEDYKRIKQWESDIMDSFCKYDVSSFEELVTNTRNKAIDDFLKNLYKIGEHRDFDWEDMYKLAEQLKAGVIND